MAFQAVNLPICSDPPLPSHDGHYRACLTLGSAKFQFLRMVNGLRTLERYLMAIKDRVSPLRYHVRGCLHWTSVVSRQLLHVLIEVQGSVC